MMKEGFEGFLMAKVMEWFALSLPPKQFLLGANGNRSEERRVGKECW